MTVIRVYAGGEAFDHPTLRLARGFARHLARHGVPFTAAAVYGTASARLCGGWWR